MAESKFPEELFFSDNKLLSINKKCIENDEQYIEIEIHTKMCTLYIGIAEKLDEIIISKDSSFIGNDNLKLKNIDLMVDSRISFGWKLINDNGYFDGIQLQTISNNSVKCYQFLIEYGEFTISVF